MKILNGDVKNKVADIEILSPAGSLESVVPAVRLGADAVYLGAEKFSARAGAKNFSYDQLIDVVEYCHVRDVKVYLVVNTLLKDSEFPDVLDLIKHACSLPVDALIIQDVGLISIIKKFAPAMRIHASTQMSIHTPSGARALYEQGFSRVVLSRELSRDEIVEIAKSSPIELEIFVHGALCMSVSGQCYLSAMIGGRSGNRGRCAQPCRLPFTVPGGTGHDLSLKDLSLVDYISDMKKIGVASVKIEGRMKRPEYVAVATKICKLAKDGKFIDEGLKRQLEFVFSRSGFTDGYYTSNRGKNMFGIRSKENVQAATSQVLSEIRQTYKDEVQKVPVLFEAVVKTNQPVKLKVSDLDGHECLVEGPVPQRANKVSLTKERCASQLGKTGGTPFFCKEILCEVEDGLAVSASSLNQVRRQALNEIESLRKKRTIPTFIEGPVPKLEQHVAKTLTVRARFPHTRIPDVFKRCELVYIPIDSSPNEVVRLMENGFNVAIEIPRGMFGQEVKTVSLLKQMRALGVTHVWAANIGAVQLARELDFTVHGGFGLNVANSFAVDWIKDFGVEDVEVSFELTANEISALKGSLKRGIIAYGRLPLMLMRNCPVINGTSLCARCNAAPTIRDRKSIEFPLMCHYGCTELLNSVPLHIGNQIDNFKNVDFLVLRFTVENSVESGENFLSFHRKNTSSNGFTRGLYSRGVD